MDTGRGASHTMVSSEGQGRDSRGWRDWREITLGEIPNVDDGVMDEANHHGMCIPM